MLKQIIGLNIMIAILLTGCVAKNNISNNQPKETEKSISEVSYDNSVGNASISYGNRKVGIVGNDIIFAINTKGNTALNRSNKKGDNRQVLYQQKAGYISNINVSNDWIYFALTETKKINHYGAAREVNTYYICKMKIDGSCFEKLSEIRIEDMWVYGNKIYYSKYRKRGATGIFCMDINGKNDKLLFDKENVWFEIYNQKIYCMVLGELNVENDDVNLFQWDIGDESSGFQRLAIFEKMSGKMDQICLMGENLYYLDEDDGELYKTNISNENTKLLRKGVSEFCIQNNKIYSIEWFNTEAKDQLCVLDLDGTYLKSICSGNLKEGYSFNGVFEGWGYFISDSIKCIKIN